MENHSFGKKIATLQKQHGITKTALADMQSRSRTPTKSARNCTTSEMPLRQKPVTQKPKRITASL